ESLAMREAASLDQAGRHVAAIAVMSRAAAMGDLSAKRTVGLRIMLGDRAPFVAKDGVRLICEAAAEGAARSSELAAILFGTGMHCFQDWSKALDWLQLAAEQGSQRAGGALRVLSPDREDRELIGQMSAVGANDPIWARLRSNIDIDD